MIAAETAALPLSGVKVLDFSSLLPGPFASLMLADAGADVVRIERPGSGDEMRSYEPKLGGASANYAILNRGKRAYAVDLKDPVQRDRVLALAAEADVVVEQFRPGVIDRLGLGYDVVGAANPRVVYCSISGYGPNGPRASRAGHDLSYLAESGLLSVVTDREGAPSLPVSVLADIAGGTYPAVLNILLALLRRDRTGVGAHLHVSMAHNLQVLGYGYIASHQGGAGWPKPGSELLTGGSPRYQVYPTRDGRHVACAALEQRFWDRLVELVDLDEKFRDDAGQEDAVISALRGRFESESSDHWRTVFEGEDICTTIVATWDEAVEAGLVTVDGPDRVSTPGGSASFPTLHSPLDPNLRRRARELPYPRLEGLAATSPWSSPSQSSGPTEEE